IGQYFQSNFNPKPDPYNLTRDISMRVLTKGSALIPIPGAGIVIPAFLNALFPTRSNGTDVWDEIKDRVEQVVDDKIDDFAYSLMQTYLIKTSSDLRDFLDSSDELKATKWAIVDSDMNDYNKFTLDNHEIVLLPLFTQFANLYFSFYRETI
ncbi:insecticidal delta-endotoxin Cry8Ea1 family protein, partial [Xanthovirga aplysinae]|uniref:insecticidal delta-endotoxin Cry8Ea1 family protein n=1 Tax=Xanthovirga aplysinae TaxID=2529853 RepID=UPI0012BD4933